MRINSLAFVATTILTASMNMAQAELNVVTSIKPIHSLVAGVMKGMGAPTLIVEGAGSPHTYALKPSQARSLQEADLVFWVGHSLEPFLQKPLESIASNAITVTLMNADGVNQIALREGGAFDAHDHDDHDDHDDHKGHDDHDDHDDHKSHDDHDDHAHGAYDPHIWLDPFNAKALVHKIEEELVESDPANAAIYEANADQMMAELDALVAEIDATLDPVKSRGFIVFHNAYQHFEQRFDMSAVGSITVSPEVLPGAERVRELQEKVRDSNASCVFSEPQFEPKLVATITENTNAATGVLDPLGASLKDGTDLYFNLIRGMAASLKQCLDGTS
ncbi:MAG: zinc ABC transporter substrate-binding protein ZnuA [Candidatus Puniceispirillaceae bacterium]